MEPKAIPSDLLASYLAEEADDAQRRMVEEWAAASEANAAELRSTMAFWELSSEGRELPEVDVDAAWMKLQLRIVEKEDNGRVRSIREGSAWLRWMAAAAIVTGLVLAARWIFQPPTETYIASTSVLEAMLPDSSRTVLSSGSSMEVRMDHQRAVRLTGEAYFEVRRDEQRPFTVATGDLLVSVLGTAFEVSAYDTSEFVSVRVRSGRVRVETGSDAVTLGAGEHAVYNKQRHILERKAAPPVEVWGGRVLQFERASMLQVVEQLQRIYKVRIEFGNERIAHCTLTAEFDDGSLATILGVIAETLELEVEETNGAYTLDGNGC